MSGPNPPEPGSGDEDPGVGQSASDLAPEMAGGIPGDDIPAIDEIGASTPAGSPDNTAYSQAYSAPEPEQFLSGPYVPVDPRLYDYDSYDAPEEPDPHAKTPRWPWVVGVTVIIAAVSLVVSVALLFARTETHDLATPETATSTALLPPVHDEITKTSPTTTPPPPPPPTSEEPPPPPPPTSEEPPPPPPVEVPAPEPSATTPEPTTTTQAKPMQVTYSVTGTKAPFDQITITYVDASGQRRTQRNAYIPWSLTLTPISQSEVGSVEASSMLRLSKLNCSITSSDGRVLSSNSNDAPATSC
ncbi:MmpS family transport accessory protein [[Mycobacterium] crassicus]|uniref:MmpS family transport accessory protein n=1 Tax=[Mycobacterium] crassicus TaxID=2872309 RepID=A0ABU5XGC6_9MYCO|nr:MmpS family transport accessory protein [Mycolicibacter sp. MYC098]MEB3020943.1 MmpS family transport accessory protein [Mycolicibacter sp. MYC098]